MSIARLRALFWPESVGQEVSDELEFHLQHETERNIARGMAPDEGRFAARRSVGNVGQHMESARDALGWTWLDHIAQDLRYGLRARHCCTFCSRALVLCC